jgi:hypothetical protein
MLRGEWRSRTISVEGMAPVISKKAPCCGAFSFLGRLFYIDPTFSILSLKRPQIITPILGKDQK